MMKKHLIGLFVIAATFSACKNQTQKNESSSKDSSAVTVKQDSVSYDEHNTKNSVDWAGTYEGTLPCADCTGIHVILTLNMDGTYEKSEEYLEKGKPFQEKGTFTWTPDGGSIILKEKDGESKYKVGEGMMKKLDIEGKEIKGELEEFYNFKKIK